MSFNPDLSDLAPGNTVFVERMTRTILPSGRIADSKITRHEVEHGGTPRSLRTAAAAVDLSDTISAANLRSRGGRTVVLERVVTVSVEQWRETDTAPPVTRRGPAHTGDPE